MIVAPASVPPFEMFVMPEYPPRHHILHRHTRRVIGPAFDTVIVNVTTSPTFGVASDTLLTKRQICLLRRHRGAVLVILGLITIVIVRGAVGIVLIRGRHLSDIDVLIRAPVGASTVASNVSTSGAAVVTDRPDHVIVAPANVPPFEMFVMLE